MGKRTIELESGKYAFDLDEHGLMIGARRHGDVWGDGIAAFAHSKCFHAALTEVDALRASLAAVTAERDALAEQVEIAVKALSDVEDNTGENPTRYCVQFALAAIAAVKP